MLLDFTISLCKIMSDLLYKIIYYSPLCYLFVIIFLFPNCVYTVTLCSKFCELPVDIVISSSSAYGNLHTTEYNFLLLYFTMVLQCFSGLFFNWITFTAEFGCKGIWYIHGESFFLIFKAYSFEKFNIISLYNEYK